jgi:hypothetical protein
VTLDELDRWLDVYGRAWERLDVDAFVACFVEDALYQWGPLGRAAPRTRRDPSPCRQSHVAAGGVRFGHEPLAITPDGRGIARWWVSMDVPAGRTIEEDERIFLVTLGEGGRCTDFREWFNSRSRPA